MKNINDDEVNIPILELNARIELLNFDSSDERNMKKFIKLERKKYNKDSDIDTSIK